MRTLEIQVKILLETPYTRLKMNEGGISYSYYQIIYTLYTIHSILESHSASVKWRYKSLVLRSAA